MAASADVLRSRLAFDRRALEAMNGNHIEVTPYRTVRDMIADHSPMAWDEVPAPLAYRVVIHVPTLVGPDRWARTTTIGINVEVPGYPKSEPIVWAMKRPYPWSPHWNPPDGRLCVGDYWIPTNGRALLGEMIEHVARLLNWDEQLKPGYTGWSAAAVAHYWARGGRPLNENVFYPALPRSILGGTSTGFTFTKGLASGGGFVRTS
jgi:hypothetical protein